MPGDGPRSSKLTTTLLVVAALIGGFLLTTTVSGIEFTPVGTIGDGESAYALELGDDRVRFRLDPRDAAAHPQASFALYDPEDTFTGYFQLEGPGDRVEVVADQPGQWVLFVRHAQDGVLTVEVADDDASLTGGLVEVPVETIETPVARQDGGPLEARLVTRLGTVPALASIEVAGTARGLQATAEGPGGVVYEIRDTVADVTENGTVLLAGDHEAHPERLTDGLYEVRATAEDLDGALTFVQRSYDRDALTPNALEPETANQSLQEVLEEGALVAELSRMQPVVVPVQGAHEILLAAGEHTGARVLVYDGRDRLSSLVQLGDPPGRSFQWDSHEEAQPVTARVPVDARSEYVLVVDRIYGGDETVLVVLPGLDQAQPGRAIELSERTTRLQANDPTGDRATGTVLVDGGLVAVRTQSLGPAEGGRTLSVEGPAGVVYEERAVASVLGGDFQEEHATHRERFASGEHRLVLETQSGVGGMDVTLVGYHR